MQMKEYSLITFRAAHDDEMEKLTSRYCLMCACFQVANSNAHSIYDSRSSVNRKVHRPNNIAYGQDNENLMGLYRLKTPRKIIRAADVMAMTSISSFESVTEFLWLLAFSKKCTALLGVLLSGLW